MRFIFAFTLCLLGPLSVDAFPQDTLRKISKDHILTTSFTQTRHLQAIPTPLISTGTLKLWPQKGLIWTTDTPFPSTLIISKTGLYQIEKNQPRVREKAIQNNMIFKTLAAILGGDFLTGLEGFDVIRVSQSKAQWHVKLTPQNPQIKDLILALHIQGQEHVQKVTIHRANGDYDDIVFTNHKEALLTKGLSSQQLGWLND